MNIYKRPVESVVEKKNVGKYYAAKAKLGNEHEQLR